MAEKKISGWRLSEYLVIGVVLGLIVALFLVDKPVLRMVFTGMIPLVTAVYVFCGIIVFAAKILDEEM